MKKFLFIFLFAHFNISMSADIKPVNPCRCSCVVVGLLTSLAGIITLGHSYKTAGIIFGTGGIILCASTLGVACLNALVNKCKRRNRQIVVAQPPPVIAPLEEIQTQGAQEGPPGGIPLG